MTKSSRIPGLSGFKEFLTAVRQEGVETGGIISARPNHWQRQWVTYRTIELLELRGYFDPKNVLLCGSDKGKAAILAREAARMPVGMLEDKPESLVPKTIGAVALLDQNAVKPITFGVAPGNFTEAKVQKMKLGIERVSDAYVSEAASGYAVEGENFHVRVVPIAEYNAASGQEFARLLRAA